MIIVLAGVAGSGKTTAGQQLAERLGWPFTDADSFHPAANIAKMRSGVPLTDADRQPWLDGIAGWLEQQIAAGRSAVAGCSALKRRYRDELTAGRPTVRLVFLQISREEAHARLAARHGHFFSVGMFASQFAELEPPQPDERVLVLDGAAAVAKICDEIITRLGLAVPGGT